MTGYALSEAQRALGSMHFSVGAVLAVGQQVIATGRRIIGLNYLHNLLDVTAINILRANVAKATDALAITGYSI